MTPLETIKAFCKNCEKEIKELDPIYGCPFAKEKKLCPQFQMVEKPLKALEIIKKKGVNVSLVLRCNTTKEYNKYFEIDFEKLTEEEYDLLREVLK